MVYCESRLHPARNFGPRVRFRTGTTSTNDANTNQGYASVARTFHPRPDFAARMSAQWERYRIPLLGGIHRDLATTLELDYEPHWRPLQDRGELPHLQ
jgi:hypothetical protein